MHDLLTQPTPRRSFVARLAATTAALGAALHARPTGAQPPVQPPAGRSRADAVAYPPVRGDWDLAWVDRLTAPHRQVFDAPELVDGMALHQVRTWIQGYKDVYGREDKDADAVLVVRHFAVPLVMTDALWDRYQLGQKMAGFTADKQPIKDPASGQPARRNPYLNANVKEGDQHATMYLWPDGGMDSLLRRGVTVLACDLALQFVASTIVAPQDKVSADEALRRVKAGLLPGVIVMPSGIFAVSRAEEAGCRYIYSA